MESKTYSTIENYLANLSHSELVQWNKIVEFESNYKKHFIHDYLKGRIEYLDEWKNNIGLSVYASRKSFNYVISDKYSELDSLNKNYFDNSFETVFDADKYLQLEKDYVKFQIDRLIEQMTENQVIDSSTSKINNLVSEWVFECKQSLLRIFKEAIE